MRRLGRILRAVATGLSALLLLATVAGWVRGYWSSDAFRLERESLDESGWRMRRWCVESGGGDVGVWYGSDYADAPRAREWGCSPGVEWGYFHLENGPIRVSRECAGWVGSLERDGVHTGLWDFGGVVLARVEGRSRRIRLWAFDPPDAYRRFYYVALPCWMAAVLFSLLPAQRVYAWSWRRAARRRARSGLCSQCGYDLRATPEPVGQGGPLVDRCPECGHAAKAGAGVASRPGGAR